MREACRLMQNKVTALTDTLCFLKALSYPIKISNPTNPTENPLKNTARIQLQFITHKKISDKRAFLPSLHSDFLPLFAVNSNK